MSAINYAQERYWEDVSVGDELPGFSKTLNWTEMVLQVSGSQDWNLVHHDSDFAQESGMPGIFYNTGWTTGMLGRLLTDWAGRSGWVEKLSFQMRGMNSAGATVRVHATVTDKRMEDDRALVDLNILMENDQVGVTTPGKATVRLPRKNPA
ncbi:MAG: MaoC/PaaZ C-terminal domain-containing protein [Gammaproteobacteria bacterium]|nr:MaoC/PaaZ C-terminal domain-containing protein [Gammaproteobacteria bacterium]